MTFTCRPFIHEKHPANRKGLADSQPACAANVRWTSVIEHLGADQKSST